VLKAQPIRRRYLVAQCLEFAFKYSRFFLENPPKCEIQNRELRFIRKMIKVGISAYKVSDYAFLPGMFW
jgi:hypothetical protein